MISSQQSAIIRYYIGVSRRYAIPEYSTGVFAALTAGRGDDFSGLSIYGTPEPNFVFATKDKGPQLLHLQHRSLFAITGRSFACSFNQALNVRARDPKHPFNPVHISRRAFFARKYALGTTGFTVILRATGHICAIFNETFALIFATAVSFSLDSHN